MRFASQIISGDARGRVAERALIGERFGSGESRPCSYEQNVAS